ERIVVEIGDLGDAKFLDYLAEKYKPQVILDDASHFWPHQILGLERLLKCLEPGGVYIIEDLVTSFGSWTVDNTTEVNPVSYLATLHALVSGGGEDHPVIAKFAPTEEQRAMAADIDLLSVYKSATLLIKKPAGLDRRQLRR